MSLETIALDQSENALHLPLVVNIFREDIFVERIAGRAVDVQDTVFAVRSRPLGKEFPTALLMLAAFAGHFQLSARPEDGPLGRWVESLGVEHGPLIVIA